MYKQMLQQVKLSSLTTVIADISIIYKL